MTVSIIGDGLVSLTLAKALVNEGIYVDLFSSDKERKINKSRTIGISKTNIDFFNKNILNIKNLLWNINKIEIFSENLENEKIFNFDNNQKILFSIVKNYKLNQILFSSLKKNKFFKYKKKIRLINTKNYNLIINCDENNLFTKKYFQKKLKKIYNSYAYTTIINHEKLKRNKTAMQIFTKLGPLAFLPISDTKTSIVFSVKGSNSFNLENLIKKYNNKYLITQIGNIGSFELNSVSLRNYYYKNILAFGDLLHKLHPLAGQGFNMSIRDIKLLVNLIRFRLENGLDLDTSICKEFEKKIKHKNYLFSSGVDFVYEFFNLESKLNNPILSKSLKFLGKNKFANKFFTKLADNGIEI